MSKVLCITRFLLISATTVAVLLLGIQSISHALTLGFDDLNDSVNPVIFVIDANFDGAVTYTGSIGSWTVNVTTGISKPLIGSQTSPKLDLNSVNVTSEGEGHLRFWVVDSGFTAAGPFKFSVGGTTEGIVSLTAFVNASNAEQLEPGSVTLAVFAPFSSDAFSGTLSDSFDATGPFALGIIGEITHTDGQISSFNAELRSVPEPASLLLLGIGLIGLAGYGRKKSSKK